MSVVNAVRDIQMRWINAVGPPTERDFRGLVAIGVVSVVVFAGCFAIGHATVSTSTPQPANAPTLPISYTGAVVPTHLADAPPIARIAVARAGARGSRHKRNTNVSAPAIATPVTRPKALTTPAPTPAPTPSPVSQPAPTTPAHHSEPHKGGGVSFDSSG